MSSPHATQYDFRLSRPMLLSLTVLLLAVAAFGARGYIKSMRGSSLTLAQRRAEVALRLDPNTATAGELQSLPRIGPTTAAKILAYRQAQGPAAFKTPADLMKIKGIGPKGIQKLTPFLRFPPTPSTNRQER